MEVNCLRMDDILIQIVSLLVLIIDAIAEIREPASFDDILQHVSAVRTGPKSACSGSSQTDQPPVLLVPPQNCSALLENQ